MGRSAEHLDVGTGAEHPVLAGRQHDAADLGVFEAQPLDDVIELDIDAEVVGIELEFVAVHQAAVLVHIHGEGRDGAVEAELPVLVLVRLGPEVDHDGSKSFFLPIPGPVMFDGGGPGSQKRLNFAVFCRYE